MAWICAKMSALAYIKFEADHNELAVLKISLESGGFSLVEMFNRNGTQAILASCEDFNILAFRGTEKDGKDIKTDLNFRFYNTLQGKLHKGFYRAFYNIRELIDRSLEAKETADPLYVAGHSLGGALACIATQYLERAGVEVAACYVYGCPRVGNAEFDVSIKTPVYRIERAGDPVPKMPPNSLGFVDAGDLRYLDSKRRLRRNLGM